MREKVKMQGINLSSADGILKLLDFYNKGGLWKPWQVKEMDDLKANVLINCEVPSDFGGPYLTPDIINREGYNKLNGYWSIPVLVRDAVFSWHYLVNNVFDRTKIPSNKFDTTMPFVHTYPNNLKDFEEILREEERGKNFIEEVCSKYSAATAVLFDEDNRIELEYRPSRSRNMKEKTFARGDRFVAALDFNYPNWCSDGDYPKDFLNNFKESNHGILFVPRDSVKGIVMDRL